MPAPDSPLPSEAGVNRRKLTMISRPLTLPVLSAFFFFGGGALLIVLALWFIGAPAHSVNLRHVAGVVEDATDTRRHKEPSGTSSFALIVKDSDGKSVPLHVVKKHVKPDDLRALVGHRVSALHHGGLVYELRSEQGILFTFNDTVPIAAPEGPALYWSGIASLAVGLLLLLAQITKGRAPRLNAALDPHQRPPAVDNYRIAFPPPIRLGACIA